MKEIIDPEIERDNFRERTLKELKSLTEYIIDDYYYNGDGFSGELRIRVYKKGISKYLKREIREDGEMARFFPDVSEIYIFNKDCYSTLKELGKKLGYKKLVMSWDR